MFKRVLLKLSGEALHDKNGASIFDVDNLDNLAKIIAELHNNNVNVAVVIGAGNIWRGKLADSIGIAPVPADFMGMLGTVINAVALSSSLNKYSVPTKVYSAIPEIDGVTVKYNINQAKKDFDNGVVTFLAGGIGKPFFTTDTAAALRAVELDCQAILMGKNKVEGVFDSDPRVNPNAKFIKEITFSEMKEKNLQIMDMSAIELLMDKDIIIRVFSMDDPHNFLKVTEGENIGTTCRKGN